MAKKSIVTIMNRVYLDENSYLYYPSHTEIGAFDEETEIFKDKNGIQYSSIIDVNLLNSSKTIGYSNVLYLSELNEQMNSKSLTDSITIYNHECKKIVYYVYKEGEKTYCAPMDVQSIVNSMKEAEQMIKQSEQNENSEGQPEPIKESNEVNENQEPDIDDREETEFEKAIHTNEVRSDLTKIFLEIIDGIYSLEELKELREGIKNQQEEIEQMLESLDIQIEASEKGESSIKLKESPEETSKKPKNYIDLVDLYDNIRKTLIAQDEPTKRVLVEIARKEQYKESKRRGLLVTGQTGSGKTKMMQLIAKYLNRPFFKIDATQLTMPGYVGKDIEEVLWDLYVTCEKNKDLAEHAIVFFDEIDKKGSTNKDDISGKGVLNVLLPFIEGSTYDACQDTKLKGEIVKLDTSNMIVILGGAFQDVYKNLKQKNDIGFGGNIEKGQKNKEATIEDFVKKAKMPEEFMGRVSVIKLNDLDVQAIKRIMLESDESAIRIQKRLFEELGVKLTIGDDYIEAIASQAEQRQTGARGINNIVDDTTWVAYGDIYTHLGEYSEIILGKETVEDPKQYKKVLKKEVN